MYGRLGTPTGKCFVIGYCRFLSIHAASREVVSAWRTSIGSGLNIGTQTGLIMMRGSILSFGRQTCFRLSGAIAGIGVLERFGYSDKKSRRFRLVRLSIKVEESADEINPIDRGRVRGVDDCRY